MFVRFALGATSKINAVVGEHRATFCALHQAEYFAAGQPLSGWFGLTTVTMLWCSWDCKNFQGWLSDSSVSSKFCRKVSDFLKFRLSWYILIMSRVYGSIGIWSFHCSWNEFVSFQIWFPSATQLFMSRWYTEYMPCNFKTIQGSSWYVSSGIYEVIFPSWAGVYETLEIDWLNGT